MSSISYSHDGGNYVTEIKETGSQEVEVKGHIPFRHLLATSSDNQLTNDGDIETVTIRVVDGLEVARGTAPENATVLDYSVDVTVSIDGVKTTKTLSNGTVSFDLTTDKPAGSTITVTAESLAENPAESDSATIEVVSQ